MNTISKALLLSTVFATHIFASTATPTTEVKQPTLETPKELEVVPVKKFDTEQATAIVEVIKNYIRTSPLEFAQLMQLSVQFKEAQQSEKTRKLLDEHKGELLSTENAIVLGNPKGTVTFVLVADPFCPNCRVLETILLKIMKTQPALKVILHQWPFLSEDSEKMAKVLQAAWKENPANFPKLLEGFLVLDKVPSDAEAKALVTGAKYDADKIKTLTESEDITKILNGVKEIAKKLDFPGTPILLVQSPDGLMVVPPLPEAEMSSLISNMAKELAASPAHKEEKAKA